MYMIIIAKDKAMLPDVGSSGIPNFPYSRNGLSVLKCEIVWWQQYTHAHKYLHSMGNNYFTLLQYISLSITRSY